MQEREKEHKIPPLPQANTDWGLLCSHNNASLLFGRMQCCIVLVKVQNFKFHFFLSADLMTDDLCINLI